MSEGGTLWNNWLLLAWLAPVAWGFGSIVDVLMIERRVYRNATHATVVSCLVVSTPIFCIALPSLELTGLDLRVALLAMLGGASFLLMVKFYYQAMFCLNDAAHAESILNLEVLIVPILAFGLLGEHLSGEHYLGIALATIGVLILNGREGLYFYRHGRVTGLLLASVFASSCSLVIQDRVFTLTSYWNGIGCYALGIVCGVLIMLRLDGPQAIRVTIWRHRKPILSAELATLIATFTELRAVDLSPSASLVAVIATTAPLMIMLVCLLVWLILRLMPACNAGTLQAFRGQFDAAPAKLAANALIIGGAFVVSKSVLNY